jgi:hypothetical protein
MGMRSTLCTKAKSDRVKGRLYSPERIKSLEEAAVLKSVTDLGDCADIYVSIARNTSMTGQKIQVGRLPRAAFLEGLKLMKQMLD